MASREEILQRIIDVVTQVTLSDKASVTGKSQLFDDLGVESIDFIDIIYNLETEFGVEIGSDAIFTDRDFFSGDAGNWENGKLTPKGVKALSAFDYLHPEKAFGPDARAYLYSVEMLVDFIVHRSGQG